MAHFPKLIPTGFEPADKNACKINPNQTTPKTGGALSGALTAGSAPNLSELTAMLSGLTDADKKILAAMLTGNGKGEQK